MQGSHQSGLVVIGEIVISDWRSVDGLVVESRWFVGRWFVSQLSIIYKCSAT